MDIDQHYNLPIVQVYSSGILFFFVTTVSGTALRVVGQTSLYTTNRFKYFKIHQLIFLTHTKCIEKLACGFFQN